MNPNSDSPIDRLIEAETNYEKSWSIGFTCLICDKSETINYLKHQDIPICQECYSDLKEIILQKRNNH
jgi:hypothetical protein